MTVPAQAGSGSTRHTAETLPIPSTPRPDATPALTAALARDISATAYRAYAAAVLMLPLDAWFALDDLATVLSATSHELRPVIGRLVEAGLIEGRMMGVRKLDGTPVARRRYRVVLSDLPVAVSR